MSLGGVSSWEPGKGGLALVVRCLLCCLVASFLLGCQTLRSWQGGCPGVYSGVKYYREQVDFLPFDGKVFFTFDLPLTALLDTLALPVTYFLSPKQPQGGFAIGCKWARGK